MTDPHPVVAEPTPAPASATVLPALIEAYPACFDWENSRPLKIDIHQDLMAAGLGEARVKGADLQRALARYCHRPLYRWTLRAGATRVDLHGQPAGWSRRPKPKPPAPPGKPRRPAGRFRPGLVVNAVYPGGASAPSSDPTVVERHRHPGFTEPLSAPPGYPLGRGPPTDGTPPSQAPSRDRLRLPQAAA